MIKINLLPSEKRKAERTPLPHFVLIVINAAALVIFAAGIAYFALIKIPDIDNQTQAAVRERQSLQKDVETHDLKLKEMQGLQAKVGQIDQLTTRNIEWWQAINAVWDVIVENDKVWIDDIKMLEAKGVAGQIKRSDSASRDAPPFGLAVRCHVAGDEVAAMTQFRTALKEHPGLKKLLPGLNIDVDWKKTEEREYPEGHSLAFEVTLMGPFKAPPKPTGPTKRARR
jgi:hypothetical protein